jgi:hypothetical protein
MTKETEKTVSQDARQEASQAGDQPDDPTDTPAEDAKTLTGSRSNYVKAEGYIVTLRGTYTRTRLVRAMSEDQAKEFAINREKDYAPKYFNTARGNAGYTFEGVEAIAATPSKDSSDD